MKQLANLTETQIIAAMKEIAPELARFTMPDVGMKPLAEYSMGYRLKLIYNGVEYMHNTLRYYSGKARKWKPVHPYAEVTVKNKDLLAGLRLARKKERERKKKIMLEQKEAKRLQRERMKAILNGTHKPLESGYVLLGSQGAITGLTESEAINLLNNKKLTRILCYRKERLVMFYAKLYNYWYVGGYKIIRDIYDNKLPHTYTERAEFCEAIRQKSPELITRYEIEYVINNEPNKILNEQFFERPEVKSYLESKSIDNK